ncbi:embryogenesis-associated protein EMB8 isoform X2 [Tripterygium wilfordii]|uniref:embryogenesis-associated protein EMB8 isoform X2 n=1 Tax=Tripterygium wilfordii TaxID=458696 RepID=UPI0018F7F87C|nr:embryogenesis-associated protein EMB8 isoform X2 [Tripterygium wilfordii]
MTASMERVLVSSEGTSEFSPSELLFKALSLIPISHYVLGLLWISLLFLYNFLEIHFLHDVITGFRGDPVSLTCNLSSELYKLVGSKCQLLHGRYLPTPWLSSPHLQTTYLSFFGSPPCFSYRRRIFHAQDGGTMALDWLMYSDVCEGASQVNAISLRNDNIPIVIVIPGLTSDSTAAYIKHLAFKMARQGCNVVISNHRGLGGLSMTSDRFYNAGWTEDIRKIVDYVHCEYPEAPLFAVGTSIGANILVKYLGEDGANVPLSGAAAVCSPWDLLVCDRFINRRLVQKLYNTVLAFGLQDFAQQHQSVLSRIADWEGVKKLRSVRDFDNYATRLLAKYETVDTYYRRCTSVSFVGGVSVPLLCISSLDDPVCTREAIPWDECSMVYACWLVSHSVCVSRWVRAVDEFFSVLQCSPLRNKRKAQPLSLSSPLESSIGEGPYVNVTEEGIVAVIGNSQTENLAEDMFEDQDISNKHTVHTATDEQDIYSDDNMTQKSQFKNRTASQSEQNVNNSFGPAQKCLNQLLRRSKTSIWLLAYIAFATTWPLVGTALLLVFKKKFRGILPMASLKR